MTSSSDRAAEPAEAPREYDGAYDEALERLHGTGPEFEGSLSNHGPMVVEVLARRGSGTAIHSWTDQYVRRLEKPPTSYDRLLETHWRAALGDARRLGDWLELFDRQLREEPWERTLERWWPRLLPGIVAGATHGVIRTGHAVQALRAAATAPRVDELGQALGYWAARWQPVPIMSPTGQGSAAALVEAMPRVPDQSGGISDRLSQLPLVADWPATVVALRPAAADQVPDALRAVVDAVVTAYPRLAHGQPTMLVHAATAPAAVLRVLPSLPRDRWVSSFEAAWSASAAVVAAYAPAPADREVPALTSSGSAGFAGAAGPSDAEDAWGLALRHGGEHVLKLADVAAEAADRVGHRAAALAVRVAVQLDA